MSSKSDPGSAVAAMPPPAPWRTSDRISPVMKMRVYQTGGRRDHDSPKLMTMCLSVRYIPAEMKAGEIIKQQICI